MGPRPSPPGAAKLRQVAPRSYGTTTDPPKHMLGVLVQGQGYLATFTFQPSEGASGVFTIAVKDNYDQTFLNDSNGVLLASQGVQTEVIGVGVDCLSDQHCQQIACQAGTCIDNACIYGNAAQGTPCDDG